MALHDTGDGRFHRGIRDRPGGPARLAIGLCVALLACGAVAGSPAPAGAAVWFARAKASGDGTSAASPIGSSAGIELATRPGDVIILLAGDGPIDGGLALKPGQTLIGHAEAGRKPAITNSQADRNGGNGVVLADDCSVLDVRIERTRASGVLGVDVSGTCLQGVEVEEANQSAGLTTIEVSLFGRLSQAGVLFITLKPGKVAENRLLRCSVRKAAGIGIGACALNGGRSRLFVSSTRAERGSLIRPLFDMGVLALADGKASESVLEMADCVVAARMSQQGRNIIAFAAADARARARIERSTSGESGQDGVIGVAAMVPATVQLEILDSTLEKAAQINLEGTILDLLPSDRDRAHESLVSIDVRGCVIRDAGFVEGFRGQAQNVWLAPSVLAGGPFARGRYRLTIRDSTVEKALHRGINVGNDGSDFKIASDEGDYDIRLRNNTIRDNGAAEVAIAAARARIDARRNFWGSSSGLADGRVILLDKAQRSQLDASEPLARPAPAGPSRSW